MNDPDRLVHVVDDDAPVRRSLDRLLRANDYEVQVYETPSALLAALPELAPGCVLLDIRMPALDGLALQPHIADQGLAVVMMSGHGDVDMAVRAMKAGAVDFLEKPFTERRLLQALDSAFAALQSYARNPDALDAAQRISTLSRREAEVLSGLAAGKAHKAIAADLGISVRTVEVHRARMLRRLGTRRLADAIRLTVLAGVAHDAGQSRPSTSV
jgi:two-component system response regulator FixJ